MRGLALIILFTLSGCAKHGWVSSERPTFMLERDHINCLDFAYRSFPPAKTISMIQSSIPITKYYGPQYYNEQRVISEDINQPARDNALKKCMLENSWRWEVVE